MSLFKKINRGVILIVIVLLAVWGYETVVYYQNKPYMDAVKPLVTQYLDISSKYSILPEDYRGADKVVPESKYNEMKTNCENELKNLFVSDSETPKQTSSSIVQYTCYGSTNQTYKFWYTEFKQTFGGFKSVAKSNNKFLADVKLYTTFTRSIVDLKTQRPYNDTNKSVSNNAKGVVSGMKFGFVKQGDRWYITNVA